jgi:hypothetical protein
VHRTQQVQPAFPQQKRGRDNQDIFGASLQLYLLSRCLEPTMVPTAYFVILAKVRHSRMSSK